MSQRKPRSFLAIREILDPRDRGVEPMLRLFASSFPPAEREPYHVLREQLRKVCSWSHGQPAPYRHFVMEADPDTATAAGMARGAFLPSGIGFVVHVAVAKPLQGLGLGERLIRHAIGAFQTDAEKAGVPYYGTIFEVERVEDARDVREKTVRERRLRFFDRLGATLLTSHYTQPSMAPGLPPVLLNLLWLESTPGLARPTIIKQFYRDAFGLGPAHPYVRRALGLPEIEAV